tara:strand:+ start:3824 stop:4894 length:1071 start_codon:yes stop_codon:yes gene_type:complete
MKVCIIGDGLVSLVLAKALNMKGLLVDILYTNKLRKYDLDRTIGISKSNVEYLNKEIVNIEKILWKINEIKVFSENFDGEEILDFRNKEIFSIIKNQKLYELLIKDIKKNKHIKFLKNKNFSISFRNKYKLIINCDVNHSITKKFFSRKIVKNYNSSAFTTIINHKSLKNNDIAIQIFTKNGPIAFLPISNNQTSVVYSFKGRNKNIEINDLIKKFNPKYEIITINNFSKFELKFSHLRKYYEENILAFGDCIHRIHPVAGQGFNMSLRDIKLLLELIDDKISLGLDLDMSICHKFQNEIKDKNFIFSTSIDWIYEIFNFESKNNLKFISRYIKTFGKNKSINLLFKKLADKGLRI